MLETTDTCAKKPTGAGFFVLAFQVRFWCFFGVSLVLLGLFLNFLFCQNELRQVLLIAQQPFSGGIQLFSDCLR